MGLDAIITDEVDDLPQAIEITEKGIRKTTQDEIRVGTDIEKQYSASKENVCAKGGIILQRSADKLKSMLPVASAQFLKYCNDLFVNHRKKNNIDIVNELSLSEFKKELTVSTMLP